MVRFLQALLLLFALALTGCLHPANSPSSPEYVQLVSRAKAAVLDSGVLAPGEVERFHRLTPRVAYYFMGRPYADYSVRWRMGGADEILVGGRGDLFKLENATVRRAKLSDSK